MLQKVRSATTSSKSNTNNGAETPVQFVKGVGPRLGAIFAARDIHNVRDLLTFFPRAYEDRTKLLRIAELKPGLTSTVAVQVVDLRRIPLRGRGAMLEVRCTDGSGTLGLKWFHVPKGMVERFKPGTQLIVTGTVKVFMSRPEIVHPEITWSASAATGAGESRDFGRIVPIYVEIEGVPSRTLRKILWEALERYGDTLTEDIPARYLQTHGLPRLKDAIREIHFPAENHPGLLEFGTPAHQRLIYEEFFKFEYLILRRRAGREKDAATALDPAQARKSVTDLAQALPFKLTGDQLKGIDEILKDLTRPSPMNRLIQGDVGSGKTAVAFLTAAAVIAEGGQVALMAPTEILAEQHFSNALKLMGGKLPIALLTGRTPQSERHPLFARLKAGQPMLLIGTHALLEDPVEFKNLTYILIDEQHRFGVDQRRILRQKGTRSDSLTGQTLKPHHLILTATPIPRTLALTAYGDLSVSTIREMPPGRSPVHTQVIRGDSRSKAYETIRAELKKGHQAYFIFPLVNDSEAEGFENLKSAVEQASVLARDIFPEFQVGLLHGQLKSDEKNRIMDSFKRGETKILVSTTVVEVGVDVPNATVMVIEHAERFGLSQLHQLRGRVGRGSAQSLCFLFAARKTGEATTLRLEVLEDTTDGFKIAEADLEIRGPGEFLGTRQAGSLPFRMAHLVRDREWLLKARSDAEALLQTDQPLELPEHLALKKYYEREGLLLSDLLKTS